MVIYIRIRAFFLKKKVPVIRYSLTGGSSDSVCVENLFQPFWTFVSLHISEKVDDLLFGFSPIYYPLYSSKHLTFN